MRSKTLSALLLSEYADILCSLYRTGKINYQEAKQTLFRYMRELGFPKEIYILAIAAFCALC